MTDTAIPLALARLFQRHGWLAVRPNFRGVGGSEGSTCRRW